MTEHNDYCSLKKVVVSKCALKALGHAREIESGAALTTVCAHTLQHTQTSTKLNAIVECRSHAISGACMASDHLADGHRSWQL